jgi:hypothetical protein
MLSNYNPILLLSNIHILIEPLDTATVWNSDPVFLTNYDIFISDTIISTKLDEK